MTRNYMSKTQEHKYVENQHTEQKSDERSIKRRYINDFCYHNGIRISPVRVDELMNLSKNELFTMLQEIKEKETVNEFNISKIS